MKTHIQETTAVLHVHAQILTNQNHKLQRNKVGILDNLENAWDIEVRPEPQNPKFESSPFPVADNMGREIFWEDIGRPEYPNLAVKLFSETCCTECECKNG